MEALSIGEVKSLFFLSHAARKSENWNLDSGFTSARSVFSSAPLQLPLMETEPLFCRWVSFLSWHKHGTLYLKTDLGRVVLIKSTSEVRCSELLVP